MTAKEMFESLGFKDTNSDESEINYVIKKGMCVGYIRFFVMQREYRVWIPSKYDFIPVEWHKAIHQQMKELGWLDV